MVSRVILARHGDIAADMSRYWGQTDVPLSAAGLEQAGRLRDRLAAEKIEAVYSSDLKRALDTATVVALPHRLAVMPCPELREIDFGQCEGLSFDEIKLRYPEAETIWTASDLGISFPGGESVAVLAERVDRFLATLRSISVGTALVVAHGGPLRVLICRLTGLNLSEWRHVHIERSSLSIIEVNSDGGTIQLLNDVSHLQKEAA